MGSSLRGGSYLAPNTVARILLGGDTDAFKQANGIASAILDCITAGDAAANGAKAFLWCYSLKQRSAQKLRDSRWYLELCPTYLSTLDGVTYWAARRGWKAMRSIVQWVESDRNTSAYLGAELRNKRAGSRFGRHLLIDGVKRKALSIAVDMANEAGHFKGMGGATSGSGAIVGHVAIPRAWRGLRGPQARKRTVAVTCPNGHNHKHGDKSPSLVLWLNKDGVTGGAQCMVCKALDTPATYSFRIESGRITLRTPAGTPMQKAAVMPSSTAFTCRRHKQNPYSAVGGLTGTAHGGAVYVGAALSGCPETGRRWRTPGRRLKRGPIEVLQWSEAQSKGGVQSDRAAFLGSCVETAGLPDPTAMASTSLCSVSKMRPAGYEKKPWGTVPVGWQPSSQEWVLVDIDDVRGLDNAEGSIPEIVQSACSSDGQLTGECAVVRTGPVGIQVWLRLAKERISPIAWFRKIDVRSWYSKIGSCILQGLRKAGAEGGFLDMSSCAAGRFGRRPGWRVLADGTVYRSRLLFCT